MVSAIEKIIRTGHGGFRERLIVKTFKYAENKHKFLNKNDNSWQESTKGLKRGVYAYSGGQWHNVKSLDKVFAYINHKARP